MRTESAPRSVGLELLAASAIVLLQELALIRWLPGEVRVLAYFPNLVLIAAFLGLGVGSLRARRRSILWLWPIALTALVATATALSGIAFTAEGVSEHLWLLYDDLGPEAVVISGIRLPIVTLFILTALSFVPLGQAIGVRLDRFREAGASLRGYAIDLGGSLAGVVAFALIAYGSLRPVIWFAPVAIGGLYLLRSARPALALHALLSVLVLGLVHRADEADLYSPYYALDAVPIEGLPDVDIRANGSLHQIAADMNWSEVGIPARQRAIEGYRIPHRRLDRPIRRALVLGAGTGNDVAVLLDEGAQEVHAVEIDPGIVSLGREVHPNDPYADARVTVHQMDGRSFLNETELDFDLIVFGTLDSMTRLSALSNVRLDNFVYTRESLAAARSRLSDDGGLALYFMVGEEHIHQHLLALLTTVFDRVPYYEQGDFSMFNSVYMAGPAFAHLRSIDPAVEEQYRAEFLPTATLPTDDWPYLYLPGPSITPFYLTMILILVGLALLAVGAASPDLRRALVTGRGVDVEMFLYGAGFLLLETKFVTAMNLAWGATWITSAVVFGSILAVILLATVGSDAKPVGWKRAAPGLVLSMAVVYLLPLEFLVDADGVTRLALSVVYVGTPVFFAALCFADRFRTRASADLAFGWNLLGAVVGGLIELSSMAIGFRALTLVATVIYLAAFLVGRRTEGATAQRAW